MATEVELGTSLTITVTFRDYSGGEDNGIVIDPDTPAAVKVYKEGTLVLDETSTKISTGNYSYTWEPSEVGSYSVDFVGDFTDQEATPSSYQVIITEDIAVKEAGSETTLVTLGRTQEITFAATISPLLLDPEDFILQYPESSLVEIAEIVHRKSVEVSGIFEGKEIPQIAYEYIREATLCELGNLYDGAMIGDGSSITLGDLSISGGPRYRGVLNRGNAANACERSYVARQEMIRAVKSSKAVVKGSRSGQKILPNRDLKHPHFTRGSL